MQSKNHSFEYWRQLQVNSRSKRSLPKTILKFLFSFIVISMTIIFFWGFGTIIFNQNVQATSLPVDTTGNSKSLITGVFFEINAGLEPIFEKSNQINDYKTHIVYYDPNLGLAEYKYFSVFNFQQMWDVARSASYVLFVLPVAWIATKISLFFGWSVGNLNQASNLFAILGAVFLTTLIIKLTTLYSAISQKKNQNKMDKIKTSVAAIKEKHGKESSFAAKQRERAEIAALYRANQINPLTSSLQGFVFAPLLFTMFIVVRYARIIRESDIIHGDKVVFSLAGSIWDKFSNFSFQAIPWRYIILFVIYTLITLSDLAFDYFVLDPQKPKATTETAIKNEKRQKIFKWVFTGFFFWLFLTVPTGTAVYWIFSGFLDKTQKFGLYRYDKHKRQRFSSYQTKLVK